MAQVPANLLLLHQGEEELRQRAVRMVEAYPNLADHLDLTERAMDVMDMLRQHYQADDDERTISHLGIRAFNDFATAWKLMASGYYQAATLILRDIVEATNLVNAFHVDRALIEKWRKADRRTLKRDFAPAAVREILDDAAGLGKSRREEIYIRFSTLAGHPTLDGFAMLRPKGMEAHIGPFSDLTALRVVVEEMGMLAPQAGFAFCIYLDTSIDACSQVAHYFLTGAMDYSGKYLGKPYSSKERAEIDRLFARSSSEAR
ncbi:hypothetical protein QFW77_00900 [Luteimonas sp. RD2P54]|uniref:Uncharacterized protein n=1 Tax=Luteimonas endophytica TaxID=3042023 RepID=A0ABT6J406_9GAMM|nr:hypothetical protein [Luteimonas endophytica]MDH5821553.1 hypothetical protein [Luteimonas endophytica]